MNNQEIDEKISKLEEEIKNLKNSKLEINKKKIIEILLNSKLNLDVFKYDSGKFDHQLRIDYDDQKLSLYISKMSESCGECFFKCLLKDDIYLVIDDCVVYFYSESNSKFSLVEGCKLIGIDINSIVLKSLKKAKEGKEESIKDYDDQINYINKFVDLSVSI